MYIYLPGVSKMLQIYDYALQANYVLGVALSNLGLQEEALTSFLRAMESEEVVEHLEMLGNSIATTASLFCQDPDRLNEMDGEWVFWYLAFFFHLSYFVDSDSSSQETTRMIRASHL